MGGDNLVCTGQIPGCQGCAAVAAGCNQDCGSFDAQLGRTSGACSPTFPTTVIIILQNCVKRGNFHGKFALQQSILCAITDPALLSYFSLNTRMASRGKVLLMAPDAQRCPCQCACAPTPLALIRWCMLHAGYPGRRAVRDCLY